MPTLILPDGSPRWVELASYDGFLRDIAAFYDEYTTRIDVAWCAHCDYLRSHQVSDKIIDAVEQYVATSFCPGSMFEQYGHLIKGQLIDANARVWNKFIKAYDDVPRYIDVPVVLDKIAQLYHNERSGRTGKGEFLIPLLFKNAVWNSHEAIYDITINDEYWHVKAIKRQFESAKLNRCGYANGQISKALSQFMSASQLSAGMKQTGLIANLENIRSLEWFDENDNIRDVIVHFQQLIDDEMRVLSVGDARGIIFYLEPCRRFIFKERDEVFCAGATQSNHLVSISPYFFVNVYDKFILSKQRAAEKEASRAVRHEAMLRRNEERKQIAIDKLARRRARDAMKRKRDFDRAHAKQFLMILRAEWKLYKSIKTAAPSFTHLLRIFVNTYSLDYGYFYSYLLNNSTCKKTFNRYYNKCK